MSLSLGELLEEALEQDLCKKAFEQKIAELSSAKKYLYKMGVFQGRKYNQIIDRIAEMSESRAVIVAEKKRLSMF